MAKDVKEIIYLEIEKSRINREKSKTVLDKSFMLYFSFLIVGVAGFIAGYINSSVLTILIVTGIVILILGTFPYVIITTKEERFINKRLEEFRK
ncbi:MAG: hypothetical protein ABIC04_05525 [Nanoarchaeota archaeon]